MAFQPWALSWNVQEFPHAAQNGMGTRRSPLMREWCAWWRGVLSISVWTVCRPWVLKTLPYFRPKYNDFPYPISDLTLKMYTLFQTLWGVVISATLNTFYRVRDFVAPQTMCVLLFILAKQSLRQHVTIVDPRRNRWEYTPYFRPNWQNLYHISD